MFSRKNVSKNFCNCFSTLQMAWKRFSCIIKTKKETSEYNGSLITFIVLRNVWLPMVFTPRDIQGKMKNPKNCKGKLNFRLQQHGKEHCVHTNNYLSLHVQQNFFHTSTIKVCNWAKNIYIRQWITFGGKRLNVIVYFKSSISAFTFLSIDSL